MNVLHVSTLIREDATVRVLDVRTPGEFDNAHIGGAYNVPLDLLGEHAKEIRATRTGAVAIAVSRASAPSAPRNCCETPACPTYTCSKVA